MSDTIDRENEKLEEEQSAQESAPHPKQQLWVDLGGMAEPQDILRREDEALDL